MLYKFYCWWTGKLHSDPCDHQSCADRRRAALNEGAE